ncbi:PTS lactose/cellobiose transporter subunit IIA [Cetobacterium somerae]|uniref:PTS lactose/cellobiose transporter subunit IIA n=1 Tax=Cetobacterium sp. NK01 TaxID=2993530 RepID=UPI002115FCE5|nr:PTS lactose/cellobiose transporter subunit IIA [Cetobacterium sp. NK01]MCQ8212072.1 PTS lactose/cellobiose transporter subunit IIA [Cetobacterium sp. NK01]
MSVVEMSEELEEIIFTIVGQAGECRGLSYEALGEAEKGDFEAAAAKLKEAESAIHKAHYVQTDLIQKEAAGEPTPISMVFVHAQDHLMTAIAEKELIKKMIKMYETMFKMNERLEKLENR